MWRNIGLNEEKNNEKLNCLQAEISQKIAENVEAAMAAKVQKIYLSKRTQAEGFKFRWNINRTESLNFPLKDTNGNIILNKEGHDSHNIYDNISVKDTFNITEGPTLEESNAIIDDLDKNKVCSWNNVNWIGGKSWYKILGKWFIGVCTYVS